MKLQVHSTPVALWQSIIHEAEQSCSVALQQELESYLVFLMMRYSNQPDVVKRIMAQEFLQGVNLPSVQRQDALQAVGDECLLFAGLFPQIAVKRLVKISYFVELGQTAYETLSKTRNDLYNLLSRHFVTLMDILQSIRQYSKQYPDLMPLQAYELWTETGSKRALWALQQYTQATPLFLDPKKK